MHTNNYIFEKNEMCLIHIPKSGGTTFKYLNNKYKLNIKAHLHRPISKLCSPIDYKYIILFRNPIYRVFSYYNMVKRSDENYPYKKFSNNIKNFLENCWEVNNMATLYLAGIDCTQFKNKPLNKTTVNDSIYHIAKNNLFHMKVIKFENYNNDIDIFLKTTYNIKNYLNNIEYLNIFQYSKDISKETISLIIKHNYYDILLYNTYFKDII